MNDQGVNIKFVQEVEKYPCLYDYRLSQYSRNDITDSAWDKVGKEMNMTGPACKQKWKNLRAVFVRQMKPGPSGSGAKKRKYYLTDAMSFILPFIKSTTPSQSSNLPQAAQLQDPIEEGNDTLKEVNQNQSLCVEEKDVENGSSISVTKATPVTKVNRRNKPTDEVDRAFLSYLKGRQTHEKEKNVRKSFLISLLDETEDMTPEQWRLFKRRVLHVIDEIKSTAKSYIDQFQNDLCSPNSHTSTFYTSPQHSSSSHQSQVSVMYNNEQSEIMTQDSTAVAYNPAHFVVQNLP